MSDGLLERIQDEADLCRNEGAQDIANLLDEAWKALSEGAQITAKLQWCVGDLTKQLKAAEHRLAERDAYAGRLTQEISDTIDSLEDLRDGTGTIDREWLAGFVQQRIQSLRAVLSETPQTGTKPDNAQYSEPRQGTSPEQVTNMARALAMIRAEADYHVDDGFDELRDKLEKIYGIANGETELLRKGGV